jgi:hypothetical protein
MSAMLKLCAVALSLTTCIAQEPGKPAAAATQPPELGTVTWQHDYAAGLRLAEQMKRPVFLLFQEIPGCDTCTGFGKNVLSHPLLKDAIECSFLPVVVRNNVKGIEEQIRERYEEPAWNNPVVRFVDASGKDILPRKDRIWDAHGIANRMVATLRAQQLAVPDYLQLAVAETAPSTETAVFEMHCYWEGEAHLGALDGVIKTTSAWVGTAEVVEVVFRPDILSKEALTKQAQQKSCKPVGTSKVRIAKDSDQQHALLGTPYAKLSLTPMQRTKVHADLTHRKDPKRWLSPSQVVALSKLLAKKTAANK